MTDLYSPHVNVPKEVFLLAPSSQEKIMTHVKIMDEIPAYERMQDKHVARGIQCLDTIAQGRLITQVVREHQVSERTIRRSTTAVSCALGTQGMGLSANVYKALLWNILPCPPEAPSSQKLDEMPYLHLFLSGLGFTQDTIPSLLEDSKLPVASHRGSGASARTHRRRLGEAASVLGGRDPIHTIYRAFELGVFKKIILYPPGMNSQHRNM